jgi:hypothetical protein
MSKMRHYVMPDGSKYPLTEAEHDIGFVVYKSDRRKAKTGDPTCCLIALGIRKNPSVLGAYIGSGKDAYVIFKANKRLPARAVHFTIPAKTAKVRDKFDVKGSPPTQQILLKAPTEARTLEARSKLNKRRRDEIKAGATISKRIVPPQPKRVITLRPRAHIVGNTVEVPTAATAA